ncbi:alkaline phosphatase D [Micromonospora pisi]|uniref:Alkaline phosphatase D n=1 Tax=Micromonospora pisi TaxID=589240 RepID=A0A495JFC8_9ACTN|nr:alkaline phosphatase D family protein [Micromonospora pisi]RKR87583.1 alkaline phosphatase D [Micromonospora pisi]
MIAAEDPRPAARLARRRFLTVTGAATALAFATNLPGGSTADATTGTLPDDPFTLGVASGDPLPEAVVIWTRLAPRPYEPLGGMPYRAVEVEWQVASDERFRHVVRSGQATARPEYSYSVHVDVRGLQPKRHYWYRFKVGRYLSPVGRTRTTPDRGQRVDQLTFAVASCQSWPDGYYTAHRHIADEDVDAVLFLGDYIYEYGISAAGGLRNLTEPVPSQFRTEADTLDRYRLQYALYKSDPDLRAAHQAAPWIATWDDHEVQDNYANLTSKSNAPVEDFLVRRASAYRAYWEHMPLRSPAPQGPNYMLYRRFTFGRLAELNVLDTRQYRSDQASGDGWKVDSEARRDPARALAGAQQQRWLLDGVRTSHATWNLLANQVVMSRMDQDPTAGDLYNMDAWDGYAAEQKVTLDGLATLRGRNPVVLTGDVHAAYALDMKRDFADPASQTYGVELVATSISSGGNGTEVSATGQKFLDSNPHLKLVNERRGYLRVRLTERELRADYRAVPYVDRPDAPVSTITSFAVEAGNPGLNPV